MKKIPLLFLLIFLSGSSLVCGSSGILSPILPYPFGQEIVIDGEPASNLRIIVENIGTSDKIETYTNDKGQYLIDLANLPQGYSIGNRMKVIIYKEDEFRTLEPILIEQEGGIYSKVEISWKDETFKKSGEKVDTIIVTQLLQKQKEEIILELNKESEKTIKTERKLSIGIALAISILSFILSSAVTRHYAIKYGTKNK